MGERVIAIGDIHGCATALKTLIEAIQPEKTDTIVPLGDYVDRGPDSAAVVEFLGELVASCTVVPLLGNHELIMNNALSGDSSQFQFWMNCGGDATLASYGGSRHNIPQHHFVFFQNCRPYYETESHIFVHASYQHDRPMPDQLADIIFWEHLVEEVPPPHISGKKVIVGHTPQIDGEIYDMGHIALIDTFCFGGKWLTALDVNSGELWQADNHGSLRKNSRV